MRQGAQPEAPGDHQRQLKNDKRLKTQSLRGRGAKNAVSTDHKRRKAKCQKGEPRPFENRLTGELSKVRGQSYADTKHGVREKVLSREKASDTTTYKTDSKTAAGQKGTTPRAKKGSALERSR